MESDNKRDDIIAKVKALWAKADDSATTEPERNAFRNKAAELMARYEIEQFDIATEEGRATSIVVGQFLVKAENELLIPDERILLAGSIARHFECKTVVISFGHDTADEETGKPIRAGQYVQVIGYKHDYEMVQALYYNLIIDLVSALVMEQQRAASYQSQFALGYIDRIDRRLGEFYRRVQDYVNSGQASSSTALAIRSRKQEVEEQVKRMYPSLSSLKMRQTKYDPNARKRGAKRADQADLGATKLGDGGSRAQGEIGAERKRLNQ